MEQSTADMAQISPPLLTAEELADALNRPGKKRGQRMLEMMRAGVIPAAIREGKFIRFDLEVVKTALAKRAAKGGRRS